MVKTLGHIGMLPARVLTLIYPTLEASYFAARFRKLAACRQQDQ
jgi:hypothetical protein